jgi:ABC-2 type transport system permease protein
VNDRAALEFDPSDHTVAVPRHTQVWREHQALLGRWAARARREPLALLALVAQPMVWLVLFSSLFAQMAETAEVPGGDYLAFMTAGAVVMTVFNATLQGGVELLFDRETGLLLRMFAAPVHRVSIVTSRFIYLAILTSAQGLILLTAAALLGVQMAAGLASIAGAVTIGALFGAGVTSLSIALAFSLRDHVQFFPIVAFVSLPLTFISSALVPVDMMPGWMQVLAHANPLTYATDAIRSLVLEGWQPLVLARLVAILALFNAMCIALAAAVLRRGLR